MAITAAAVSDNNQYGPDVVAYDITDDGLAATGTVTITAGQVFIPEYAYVQATSTAAAGRNYAAIINSGATPPTITVTTAVTVGAAATARVFIGRWPRPQNRS